MSVSIENISSGVLHRQVTSSSAVLGGGQDILHDRAQDGARRVEPVAAAAETKEADDERLANEEKRQSSENTTPQDAVNGGEYDRQMNYDKEAQRFFLEIVNTQLEKTIVSMPPKKVVEFLDQAQALSADRIESKDAPQVNQSA
jgi:hypothetical protein